MTTTCTLCAVYSSRGLNPADGGGSCYWCRQQLDRDAAAVRAMYHRALEADDAALHEATARDTVSRLLPMAPTPPPSSQPRVSGSRERSIPINVRLLDLTGPVVTETGDYGHGDDQVGDVSVGTVLWAWAVHWRRLLPSQLPTLPKPDGRALLDWLSPAVLDVVVAQTGQVSTFAWQLRTIRRSLQSLLGDTVPYPAVMWGVPCRRCDLVSTLVLDLEDPDHFRECTSCGLLMTEQEYKLWLRQLVEALRPDDTGARTGRRG